MSITAFYSSHNAEGKSTVTLALVDQIIEKINSEDKVTEMVVTISDEIVDASVEEQVGTESVTIMGIHTFFLVESPVSKERLMLEYTAICVLAEISTKYLLKYPEMSKKDKVSTSESLVVVISFQAFQLYQTMTMGLRVFQNIHNVKSIHINQIKVLSKRFGEVKLPTSKDKERLAYATQFTTDVFKASNLDFKIINGLRYLDTTDAILPSNRFYIQTFDEGEEKFEINC